MHYIKNAVNATETSLENYFPFGAMNESSIKCEVGILS